jgi:SNF2 family DNA or RNA helicase
VEIINNQGLLVRVRDYQAILTAIQKSKKLHTNDDGTHDVLVHWTLENSRRLANLGVRSSPAPIERDYDWPGMFTPFDHQKKTAAFLAANNRAFCFSEQGTGKSKAVLWAADYLMRLGDIKRVLIVSPLSIMYSAWMDELFKTVMHRSAAVAHGSRQQRIEIINGDYEFVVINYDGVKVIANELAKGRFDLIVLDECNYVKTVSTSRWKAVNSLIYPSTKVWLLTGTPAAQSPEDAYGIGKLAVPHRVPKYLGAWRDRVMYKVSQFKWVPRGNAIDQVRAALQPAIRFTKAECLDLPPVTYQTRFVPLTDQQEKYYAKMKKEMYIEAAGESISAVHAAAGLNKLLQLSAGAVYADNKEVVQFDASNRVKEVLEVVREASHKVIVFVPFRHAIDILTDELRKQGISTEIINGGVSMLARTRIFKEFQETDSPRVLVVQPQSASHGVTLTAADTIVWFGPTASVETWLQANERINRPSQKNKMTIVKIYGSAVEKKLYDVLESREANQKALVALYESEITEGERK